MALLDRGKALLWPDRCVLCDKAVAYGEICCPLCRRETPLIERPILQDGMPVAAVWRYRGQVPAAVRRFKFQGNTEAGRKIAHLMARAWQELCPQFQADCVTFVPIPPERESRRGYNQAELLARWVGRELRLPVEPLLRREGVLMQHQLSAGFRKRGINKAFRLLPGVEKQAAGRCILLVDDVVTTGGTVRACAERLLDAGAERVAVLAIAVAGGGKG